MKISYVGCLFFLLGPALVAHADYDAVLGLRPAGDHVGVAIEIETSQGSALSGLRWFNNDESYPFPRLVLVEGEAGQAPDLTDPGLILLELEGESLAWGEVNFGGALTSSTGVLHAVFFYPENVPTEHIGEGGGPGLGVREAEGARPFYITGDGLNWARFNPTFEIGVEPIPALMRGEARVLSEMDGEVLVLGRGDDDQPAPVRTMLDKPFPNPFNPQVELAYSLARPGLVTLHVFDVKGRLVDTLVSENQPVGRYTVSWDGTDHEGSAVASGVYFARFMSGDASVAHRMVLLK